MKTVQKNISDCNDVVAGSKYEIHNIRLENRKKADVDISELVERINTDRDEKIADFIEELMHMINPVDDHGIDGLHKKLADANRRDLIVTAVRLKENFYKTLEKYKFSRSAQIVFARAMEKVESKYLYIIHPQILEGKPRIEIDRLIETEIVEAVELYIGRPDLVGALDVSGMMYFLTGNCHISWK